MPLDFGPSLRRNILDLPVGHGGETCEDIAQVGVRIDMATATGFDEGVEDGAAVTGGGIAEEEPVFLSDGGGSDGVFDEVIVDLNSSVVEEHAEEIPIGEGVVDGHAHAAAREIATGKFEADEDAMNAEVDHAAVAGADNHSLDGTGLLVAQDRFDVVEVGDLAQEPGGAQRSLWLGFEETASGMRPATGQCNLTLAFLDEAWVRREKGTYEEKRGQASFIDYFDSVA